MNNTDKLYKADVDFAALGDNTVIAAPSAGRIAVDFILVFPEDSTTIQLLDGSTDYGGEFALDAKQPFVIENTAGFYDGVITLTKENALVINSSAAVQVSGFVRYRVLDAN